MVTLNVSPEHYAGGDYRRTTSSIVYHLDACLTEQVEGLDRTFCPAMHTDRPVTLTTAGVGVEQHLHNPRIVSIQSLSNKTPPQESKRPGGWLGSTSHRRPDIRHPRESCEPGSYCCLERDHGDPPPLTRVPSMLLLTSLLTLTWPAESSTHAGILCATVSCNSLLPWEFHKLILVDPKMSMLGRCATLHAADRHHHMAAGRGVVV
ncbi:hypothetical protein B0T18DRAFT_418069 [Schizothecium vesticola]|uniref:Uncharacterized protein n=1 Tax=Schizothecium vesticola TaxID=314040 RepID=A0AA40EJH3_9PEZI|nr:hypothetical protein B0T18DRAFT_418069 [Schizothecium vesticola]